MVNKGKKIIKKQAKAIKLYTPHLICLGILVFISVIMKIVFSPMPYTSDNVRTGTDSSETVMNISYAYYLDVSPSMYGYVNVDSNLKELSHVLRSANQNKENLSFYLCGNEVTAKTEMDFYDFMEDADKMDDYYRQLIGKQTFADASDNMDLSNIFTDLYDNGSQFNNGENMVYVIISDFDFRRNASDIAHHNEYLTHFGRALAGNAQNANICIYNIQSQFNGFFYDEYRQYGDTSAVNGASFFMILMSESGWAYDNYKRELENQFLSKGVSVENSYELKKNLLEGEHEIKPDMELFKEGEPQNLLINFNRNSKYFRRLGKDIWGFQIVNDSSNSSAIQMAVEELNLSGYSGTEESLETKIETQLQMYDAKWNGYKECEDLSGITYCEGDVRLYNGKWYLYLDLEIEQDFNGQVGELSRKYCVIDILFLIDTPGFALPDWLKELNTEEVTNDITRKINIIDLVEQIGEARASGYAEGMNDYQRQLGNIQLYINY